MRMSKRDPPDEIGNCQSLSTIGFQKFQTRGRRIEKIGDLDTGTGIERCRFDVVLDARLLQRGGAAAVFGVGLFGTLFALMLS